MSKRKTYEVQPRPDGKWQVILQGGSRALSVHDTKTDAVAAGVEKGRAAHPWGQLIIKKRNGQIQSERTYGNDPRSSKG